VAGYLAHTLLAAFEAPAERFLVNVVLVRVFTCMPWCPTAISRRAGCPSSHG
jgi:hypothetical protein